MKNLLLKSSFLLVLLFGALLALTGCEKKSEFTFRNILDVDTNKGYSSINLLDCQYNLDYLPLETLSDAERNSILFMREEEKLARDIYLKLYEKWDLQVFNNISQSEQTHTEAVLMLIEKYGLTDPAANKGIGEFTNSDLQTLYDNLILQSDADVVAALEVGALVEEIDILDLKNALNSFVDNRDITMVYENLMKASRNHLRAFVRNLLNQGVAYVPQKLTETEYNEIINSDWERGRVGW